MPTTIRRAAHTDADAVTRVFLDSRRRTMPFLPDLHTTEETRDFIASVVLRECEVLIAHDDGREILGFAALDAAAGTLEHLYLHPDHRRRGIGTLLLDRTRSRCPAGLRLYCFAQNHEARAFYEHHGFTILLQGDGSENEEGLPDLLYSWRPSP